MPRRTLANALRIVLSTAIAAVGSVVLASLAFAPSEQRSDDGGAGDAKEPGISALLYTPQAPAEQEQSGDEAQTRFSEGRDRISYDALVAGVDEIARDGRAAVVALSIPAGEELVSINANEQYTPASTYKLFVAKAMIDAVDQGRLSWDSIVDWRPLRECMDDMILWSDNDCPEAWFETEGFGSTAAAASEVGAASTVFDWDGFSTTAQDLARLLLYLQTPGNMSNESQEHLLWAMENQEFRDGIPAAIEPQGTVADKVGFLDGLLHDAAIVHSDRGDYVLVILTEWLSWDDIARIASLVESYL